LDNFNYPILNKNLDIKKLRNIQPLILNSKNLGLDDYIYMRLFNPLQFHFSYKTIGTYLIYSNKFNHLKKKILKISKEQALKKSAFFKGSKAEQFFSSDSGSFNNIKLDFEKDHPIPFLPKPPILIGNAHIEQIQQEKNGIKRLKKEIHKLQDEYESCDSSFKEELKSKLNNLDNLIKEKNNNIKELMVIEDQRKFFYKKIF